MEGNERRGCISINEDVEPGVEFKSLFIFKNIKSSYILISLKMKHFVNLIIVNLKKNKKKKKTYEILESFDESWAKVNLSEGE